MSTTQIIVTIVGALLTSNVLTAFVTAWLVRPKTTAEAKHENAQAGKADADTSGVYFGHAQTLFEEMREMLGEVRSLNADLMGCRQDVAKANIEKSELKAEKEHLEKTIKLVRDENVEKDRKISELLGNANE